MRRLRGAQPPEGRGGFLPITVCLPSPSRWPGSLGVGEVGEGAIKWRRGRSEAQSFAQASAPLPEVKSGREEGVCVPGREGDGGACCFSRGPYMPVHPVEGFGGLRPAGRGLVVVPEVMAAGGGVSLRSTSTSAGGRCPSPCCGRGGRRVTCEAGSSVSLPAQ